MLLCIYRRLAEMTKKFEEEKETFIHEYGYVEYMRQYLVSEENLSDGEEECHDDGGDEYDECTDDEYLRFISFSNIIKNILTK